MAPTCGGPLADPRGLVSSKQFHTQTLLGVRCFASPMGREAQEGAIGSALLFQGEGHDIVLGKIRKGSRRGVASEMSPAEQEGLW